jgi:hypothetical protein
MKRREFVKYSSSLAILLANGNLITAASSRWEDWGKAPVKLRFVIASDGHYGEPGTDYQSYFETVVTRINEEHKANPFAFCMINGDIVHNDKAHYPAAKKILDGLQLKYFVSQGNHDQVTPEEWQAIWNMPVNHDFAVKENSFLIATTSDVTGAYVCPDVNWIRDKLAQHAHQKNIFLFLHINPGKLTKNAIDCPALFDVFAKHKNIKAVFNGHDHDQEGILTRESIPFIFDAHFGGSWGTSYRGFRVVELMEDNSMATYIMNPLQKINETLT